MIGHALEAALPFMRANAASLRTATCVIERLTRNWNAASQKTESVWEVVHPSLPCHLDLTAGASRSLLTEESVTPETALVKLSHEVTDVKADDQVTVVGYAPMWVTRSGHDDSSHPVETVLTCRWTQ